MSAHYSIPNIPSESMSGNARRSTHLFPVHNYGFASGPASAVGLYRSAKAMDNGIAGASQDIGSRFGRRLRELRQERSLTQSEMAKKFGIDRSFISDVERGRKSISLGLLEVVAIGLKVSLSDLFRDL